MSTKGASNRYGHNRNGRIGKPTKNTSYAWAKDFNIKTLTNHFIRHGEQMGCTSKESYAAHAVKFANKIDKVDCVSFVDRNGSTYKYNKKKNILAIVTKDGYVVTYFKPKTGFNYYLNEKRRKKR
jgi:pyocin large subunit-like protein